MRDYTRRQRAFLDTRFMRGSDEDYFAHSPIFGLENRDRSEAKSSTPRRYALPLQLMRLLDRLRPESVLDVGCAEGLLLCNVRELLGVRTLGTDLSLAVCERGRRLLGNELFAAEADLLPLADNSFDVVVISEVIEHLENPFHALAECHRVARHAVIATTQEFLHGRFARWAHLAAVNPGRAHTELNFFLEEDFRSLFGSDRVRFFPQGSERIADSTVVSSNPAEAIQQIVAVADDPTAKTLFFGKIAVIGKSAPPRELLANKRRTSDQAILTALFRNRTVERAPQEKPFRDYLDPATLQPLELVDGDGDKAAYRQAEDADAARYPITSDGTPDFTVQRDPDRRGAPLDALLAERKASEQQHVRTMQRRFGGMLPWRSARIALAGFVADTHFDWRKSGLDAAFLRRTLGAASSLGKAFAARWLKASRAKLTLDVSPASARLDEEMVWNFPVKGSLPVEHLVFEISDPGEALPPPSASAPGNVLMVFVPWDGTTRVAAPASNVFSVPGEYEVRFWAVGAFDLCLAGPSNVVRLDVRP